MAENSENFDPVDFYPIEDIAHTNDIEVAKPNTWKSVLWRVTKIVLILGVTGGLLTYVFSKIPFAKVEYRLLHADPAWVTAGVICYIGSMLLSSWRLLSFFKSIHLRLNYKFNLRLYFLGLCYNVLLPGGIGGDGYKIYLLHKKFKLPTKKVFFSILFDRLSGFWAIGLIAVTLIILIPSIEVHQAIPIGIFAAGTIIYYFIAYKYFKDYTHNFIQAHLKAIGVQLCQVLTIVCLLMAQNFHAKFAPYLLSFLVSSLAAILPSLGGGGVREAIFIYLVKPFHLIDNLAVYLSVGFYLISIFIALFGVYYVIRTDKLEAGLAPDEKTQADGVK